MSSKYPALDQMGIKNPEQISSYDIAEVAPDEDLLRIRYSRPKGSFLPVTRSYKFHRTSLPNTASAPGNQPLIQYEIAPLLNEAIQELDSIVNRQKNQAALIEQLEEQLLDLEKEFRAEVFSIKATLDKLKKL